MTAPGALATFAARRMVQVLLSMVVAALLVFGIARLSGDPIEVLAPVEASSADIDRLRAEFGLDGSIVEQFGTFASNAVQGDFGESLRFSRPATEVVAERVSASLELVGLALLISLVVGVPLGAMSAARAGSRADRVVRALTALGQAAPPYVLGLLLILIFGVQLGVLPTSGTGSLQHLVLPAVTLATFSTAAVIRLTRTSMLEVLGSEYVRYARMKGMPERRVIWRHGFKNAAIGIIAFAGIVLVTLINGSILVETIFAWPGVGQLMIESVRFRDYPVVQAAVLMIAATYLIVGLLTDLLARALDPRSQA